MLRTLIPAEKAVNTRDGRWFVVRIMPYRTPDNRIDGLVLTFTETTSAKLLERELRATAGQFQAFLDLLPEGYALCAAIPNGHKAMDGRLLHCNQAFARMLPDPDGTPDGRTLLEVLPALRPILGPALARTSLTGEFHVFEGYLELGTGSFELTTYRPAPDQFVCIFRDGAESGRLIQMPSAGDCHEDAKPAP